MTYPYNANIPQASDDPADSQPLIFQNYGSIEDLIEQDHFPFNNSLGGTHKQVTLTNESAPGLGVGNGVLFSNAVAGVAYPFWQNTVNTTQLFGAYTISSSGSITLPGGLILQWGTGSIASGSNVKGTISFTFPNNCFGINLQLISVDATTKSSDNTLSVTGGTISTSGFSWIFNGHSGSFSTFFWFAVGN